MNSAHDVIVVGAGLGGLTVAALLARAGRDVLLLEAHTVSGGCASYFSRKKFLFDAGATTLSGLHPGQPISALESRLDIAIPIRHCDPGMIAHRASARIRRYADPDRWIAECERVFGPAGQRAFWTRISELAQAGWNASIHAARALPFSMRSVIRAARPEMLRHTKLFPSLFRSVADEAKTAGVWDRLDFRAFLSEQLMITTQSHPDDTPLLVGAMGLEYPADTWYPDGGMNALPRALLRTFRAAGGQYHSGERVVEIDAGSGFTIRTASGNIHNAGRAIVNLPVWNAIAITGGRLDYLRPKYDSMICRGAVTYYAGIADEFEDHGSCYHQILLEDPLPWCGGRSLFVSASHRDDPGRAPRGFRTVTVSTHIENTLPWLKADEAEYGARKEEVLVGIERRIDAALPGFARAEKPVRLLGTPRTFIRYTGRSHGWVGGIPHSLRRPLFTWQGHRTRVPGLHLVGDTVYPGQGAPAVVLGAMHVADELLEES
jgi:C-3',4' desaturase CrtD